MQEKKVDLWGPKLVVLKPQLPTELFSAICKGKKKLHL